MCLARLLTSGPSDLVQRISAGWTNDVKRLADNSLDLGDGMDEGRPCNNWVIIVIELSPLSLIVRLTQFEYS